MRKNCFIVRLGINFGIWSQNAILFIFLTVIRKILFWTALTISFYSPKAQSNIRKNTNITLN